MAINFNELEEALYHIRVNHLGNCDLYANSAEDDEEN